jgi:hypothetical protein
VLSDAQIDEFAERGYLVVRQVVHGDVLDDAMQRIDQVTATEPPAHDKHGAHFYSLDTKDESALIAPLTSSPAFGLAEELAGLGTLKTSQQVQISLNIPPYSHRPGAPHIDTANIEPTRGPSAAPSPCWPGS